MSEATLYLVRHAHAVWRPDEQHRLSEQGRAAAERVAEVLQPFPIAAIYASPYPRAIETVEPLARHIGCVVRVEEDLRERRLSHDRVPDFHRAVRWAWDHDEEALPGGESNRDARSRALALVERMRVAHADADVVVSTHGSLAALLLRHFDRGFTFEDWARMTMPDVYRLSDHGRVSRLWGSP